MAPPSRCSAASSHPAALTRTGLPRGTTTSTRGQRALEAAAGLPSASAASLAMVVRMHTPQTMMLLSSFLHHACPPHICPLPLSPLPSHPSARLVSSGPGAGSIHTYVYTFTLPPHLSPPVLAQSRRALEPGPGQHQVLDGGGPSGPAFTLGKKWKSKGRKAEAAAAREKGASLVGGGPHIPPGVPGGEGRGIRGSVDLRLWVWASG